ncbi:MAG: hypothetical protein ABSF26_28300 [Thermoguttaceae bacterium]
MSDDLPNWTQQRRELASWLDDRAPSFAQGYLAAIRLLYAPAFPARVHLVCHVVRDIYRYLPAALGSRQLSRRGEVFPNMVKQLANLWERFPPLAGEGFENDDREVRVPAKVYRYVAKIVVKSQELARDQSTIGRELAISLFRSGDRREGEFIDPWIIKSFDEEYDFFVGRAHIVASEDRITTDDGLVAHFEAFERAFHSMVGPYFTGKEELDAILQDTNAAAG